MNQVSETEFFRTVGQLNVHPRVDVATLKGRNHVSHWEMLDGARRVVGRSESDSWDVEPTKFFSALAQVAA